MSTAAPHAPVPAVAHLADAKPRRTLGQRIGDAFADWLFGDEPIEVDLALSRLDRLHGVGNPARAIPATAPIKEQS